ncbi:hypothetical protein HOLleu_41205 [Holothuria leucospilota]|uniref:Integrase catalytic domain-containing protein n=1 Tax=Holothuria leucospilota TaxID=206669 RepID=A0A9Q0YIV4_HOLLE|nr:hypothetical protein HOLleu_41205 [Holothuria leucospilota]
MAFTTPSEFVSRTNLDVESVDDLSKAELVSVAKYLKLEVPPGAKKSVLNRLVLSKLIELGHIDSDVGDIAKSSDSEELQKLRIQLQLKEIDFRAKEKQLDFDQKVKEMEHEKAMKEMEMRAALGPHISTSCNFDFSKNVRLVPKFDEKDVDRFFTSFETLAKKLDWPSKYWSTLLHSVFTGKAKDVYSSLSYAESSDYDKVKEHVLKSYQLVPEAYRQKFRNTRQKGPDQTYVEFSRVKSELLDKWISSRKVGSDFAKLRELILLEEFCNCVPREIRTHLSDRGVEKLEKAAIMSDDYELAHKSSFGQSRDQKSHKGFKKKDSGGKLGSGKESDTKGTPSGDDSSKPAKGRPTCSYCHKIGHTYETCFKRLRDLDKPTAFISSPPISKMDMGSQSVLSGSKEPSTLFESSVSCSHVDYVRAKLKKHGYDRFISLGTVTRLDNDESSKVVILRDTGASRSLMLRSVLPLGREVDDSTEHVLVRGIGEDTYRAPLVRLHLECEYSASLVEVGIVERLPADWVDFLLGNDIAGGRVYVSPSVHVCSEPRVIEETERLSSEFPGIFPACVTTRSMARSLNNVKEVNPGEVDDSFKLAGTFFENIDLPKVNNEREKVNKFSFGEAFPLDSKTLILKQKADDEVRRLFDSSLSEEEVAKVPGGYYISKSGVLMRKWRHPEAPASDDWRVYHQIIVPKEYRAYILKVAHDLPMSGHLGVRKTQDRILRHFFWPRIHRDVSDYCRSCPTCQLVGKPNQKIQNAPLMPIPAMGQPFERVLIDCVGPLPKTRSGFMYILTIMDVATRYPEAIPLRNISAKLVTDALVKFFTRVGLPKEVQHDQGSNFMSELFKSVLSNLGIKQIASSAYHPQSQGALERYHQTLKTMIKAFCHDNQADWDKGLDFLRLGRLLMNRRALVLLS